MTLTVTVPAEDLALLSAAEMRAAVGVEGGSRDADLRRLNLRISASIAEVCRIAGDGVHPPTLKSETLSEVWRPDCRLERLILARRRVSTINAVIENGEALGAADYELWAGAGLLQRLCGDRTSTWPAGKITVEFVAGFVEVPDGLKLAAETYARALWREGFDAPANVRDPLLRRRETPGVLLQEWWVDPSKDTVMPPEVRTMLEDGGYIETLAG